MVVAKRKRLTAAERRAQLMRVARATFAERGFEGTSVEEIALRAGVSKPIVYEHFGGKEGLYAAIVEAELDSLVARVSAGLRGRTPREKFEGALEGFMQYAEREPDGFAVMTREAPGDLGRKGLARAIEELVPRVGDVFRVEFERAGFDARLAPIYAHALLGMVTHVGLWWAVEGRDFARDEVVRHVAALGWMGLRHLPHEPPSVDVPPGLTVSGGGRR